MPAANASALQDLICSEPDSIYEIRPHTVNDILVVFIGILCACADSFCRFLQLAVMIELRVDIIEHLLRLRKGSIYLLRRLFGRVPFRRIGCFLLLPAARYLVHELAEQLATILR